MSCGSVVVLLRDCAVLKAYQFPVIELAHTKTGRMRCWLLGDDLEFGGFWYHHGASLWWYGGAILSRISDFMY